jgi:ribosomal protein S18 acetylase RimI-like enzyme
MSEKDIRMIYKSGNGKFKIPPLDLVNYNESYFMQELDLESDIFYELRKANGIEPYRINESPQNDLNEIRDFFSRYKDTFFFYFMDNDLVGSILFKRNYIQSLSIAKKYQRQGYGTLLSKFAINYILDKGYSCVELNVIPGNASAIKMYQKIGFEII